MGAKMPDCRGLVPRTPPEGLREWAVQNYSEELDLGGLVYEVEYAEDYGLHQLLDEWARPRKVKMVRVRCSVCGESMLLHWGKDAEHGYGFILPEDVEGDYGHTVTTAGDEVNCPICGHRVLVNKAAAVGRSYYVAAECHVLSASLVGEDNWLALTGWTVQCRVFRSGSERLELIPAEAYVFSRDGCAQLVGWRSSYSGNAGYFISYTRDWRQPERWCERWGEAKAVFGLTAELVEHSCLPHCKLDMYMQTSFGAHRFPVAYLRLYQARPRVEHVLVHGLPRVLLDLIAREVRGPGWEKNVRGRVELPEMDWEESRPAQMLRLTKEELRLGREQDWGLFLWELFVKAKEHGETLTGEDVRNVFRLGDDHTAELIGRGPVGKSIRYLLRQCEALTVEEEDEDPDPMGVPDVQTLMDYWNMAGQLSMDLNDPAVRFPRDLLLAHDRASERMEERADAGLAPRFRLRRRLLQKYCFRADGLLIRPAASQRELTEEGRALCHCVGTYGKRHAAGETAIFFIRRAACPRKSWYTLELDEKRLAVRQNRGMCNCACTPEVNAFVTKWLEWVRAGSPRDAEGRPVIMAEVTAA